MMLRLLSTCIVVLGMAGLLHPATYAAGCLPTIEYAPPHIPNPEKLVTFSCESASPLDVIRAVGIQTRLPIGIELGKDRLALEKTSRSYALQQVSAAAALQQAISGTGYAVRQADGVTILIAGDLTPRQHMLIGHTFTDFKSQANATMIAQGFSLQMWLGAFVDPRAGFGASLLGSMNDERFTLLIPGPMTTEAIVNMIVNQGSKGLWVLWVDPSSPFRANGVSLKIEPYQHYSNAAVLRRSPEI